MKKYERVTGSERVRGGKGTHWHAQNYSNCIVISEEELLDLMQESIEHSYPTLQRDAAKKLLDSKLNSESSHSGAGE